MSTANSDQAAQVIWPWRSAHASTSTSKPVRNRPLRGAMQAALMVTIASLIYRFAHHHVMPLILCGIATFVLVSSILIHPAYDAFERFIEKLVHWFGVGLTWGLLVPFFYLCFVPARLVLVLKGKDPMQRKCPTDADSYWEKRPPVRSIEQYRKQH